MRGGGGFNVDAGSTLVTLANPDRVYGHNLSDHLPIIADFTSFETHTALKRS
jgi:hypothetical protein